MEPKKEIILKIVKETNTTQNVTNDKIINEIEKLLNNTPCESNIDNQIKVDITDSKKILNIPQE